MAPYDSYVLTGPKCITVAMTNMKLWCGRCIWLIAGRPRSRRSESGCLRSFGCGWSMRTILAPPSATAIRCSAALKAGAAHRNQNRSGDVTG